MIFIEHCLNKNVYEISWNNYNKKSEKMAFQVFFFFNLHTRGGIKQNTISYCIMLMASLFTKYR